MPTRVERGESEQAQLGVGRWALAPTYCTLQVKLVDTNLQRRPKVGLRPAPEVLLVSERLSSDSRE